MVGLSKDSKVTELFEAVSKDVVRRYTVHVEEVHLRGSEMALEEQLARVNAEISDAPAPVAVPKDVPAEVKKVLDEYNAGLPDVSALLARKAELKKLIGELEAVGADT